MYKDDNVLACLMCGHRIIPDEEPLDIPPARRGTYERPTFPPLFTRTCRWCGEEFESASTNALFCTVGHKEKHRRARGTSRLPDITKVSGGKL